MQILPLNEGKGDWVESGENKLFELISKDTQSKPETKKSTIWWIKDTVLEYSTNQNCTSDNQDFTLPNSNMQE